MVSRVSCYLQLYRQAVHTLNRRTSHLVLLVLFFTICPFSARYIGTLTAAGSQRAGAAAVVWYATGTVRRTRGLGIIPDTMHVYTAQSSALQLVISRASTSHHHRSASGQYPCIRVVVTVNVD